MTGERWQTMPTQMLLEQARALAEQPPDSEVSFCIHALACRLEGSEEWVERLKRRARAIDWEDAGLDEALRSYGRRLGELTRQYPFSTIEMGSAIREDASDVAAHFFSALLEVLCEAGLIAPGARGRLADWLLDEVFS